jgi:hypothetical protein
VSEQRATYTAGGQRVEPVDLGKYAQLRWGVVLHRAGRRPALIAQFAAERERDAYVIQRGRAERRVAGVRA